MTELAQALEAILFSSNRPLKVRELQQATESGSNEVQAALDEIAAALADRGLRPPRQGGRRGRARAGQGGVARGRDPAGRARGGDAQRSRGIGRSTGQR